jgi:hypothetical protein
MGREPKVLAADNKTLNLLLPSLQPVQSIAPEVPSPTLLPLLPRERLEAHHDTG